MLTIIHCVCLRYLGYICKIERIDFLFFDRNLYTSYPKVMAITVIKNPKKTSSFRRPKLEISHINIV